MVMLYHEATPNDQQETAQFVVGNQEINWSGADSRTHKASYKPHMNIVFLVVLPFFLVSFEEKHVMNGKYLLRFA